MTTINVPHVVGCTKQQYTCTLSGSPEVNGDHVATIHFPDEIQGEVLYYGETVWRGLQRTESFYFSSIGETYKLRLWTYVEDNSVTLKLPYTVSAIYAPSWASINEVIFAVPVADDDNCCNPVEAENISSSGFSITPGVNVGVNPTWTYEHPTSGCTTSTGSGKPGTGGYRAYTELGCSPLYPVSNTMSGGQLAEVTVTPTWTAGNKPYNWLNTAFSIAVVASTSANTSFLPADVAVSNTANVTTTVRKVAGSETIYIQVQSSYASCTSSATYEPNEVPDQNCNITPCPSVPLQYLYFDLPCTDVRMKVTINTVLHQGGEATHQTAAIGMSATALFIKPS